jgi:hypothetical protein
MAKNRVHRAGPELITESSFYFEKQEDGYFKRVENIHERDIKTNSVKLKQETVSDEKYKITREGDYDYQVSYDDPDSGTLSYLRFKKVK